MVGARPTTFKVAIAMDVAGALIEVTDYLESTESFDYSWGLDDPFGDVRPGEFSFTLSNADGRFTPDNPASPYALTLTEGMRVTWQLNTRVVSGRVQAIEPVFPGDESAWAQVRVTCDDILGELSRAGGKLSLRGEALATTSHWPFTGTQAQQVFDTNGALSVMRVVGNPEAVQFGVDIPGSYGFDTGALINGGNDPSDPRAYLESFGWSGGGSGIETTFTFRPVREATNTPRIMETTFSDGVVVAYRMGRPSTAVPDRIWVDGASADMPTSMQPNRTYHLSLAWSSSTGIGTATWVADDGTSSTVTRSGTITGGFKLAVGTRICQDGAAGIVERVAVGGTYPALFAQLGNNSTAIGTRFTDLSQYGGDAYTINVEAGFTAYVGAQGPAGQSRLDRLTAAMATEGGRIWAIDTGTLTAPVPTVNLRPRTLSRDTSVDFTFHTEEDLAGSPEMIRGLTNAVAIVNARSATDDITVTNSTVQDAVGDTSDNTDAPAYDPAWLRNLAEDRIRRGSTRDLRLTTITIDARLTKTNRWADLLALEPGDRIQVTGLPSTQLGRSTLDAWFIGGEESHTTETDRFTLHVEPTLDAFVFDTARFASGGTMTLTAAINAAVTSFTVTSTDALFTTAGGNFPQKIIIDREILTVTAVSGAASPQTFTVTRAATNTNGVATVAASHLISAPVEIYPAPVFSL